MDVTPLISPDKMVLQSYKGGEFRVSGRAFDHPVIVFPEAVVPWEIATFDDLKLDDFQEVITAGTEILLIGTGEKMQRLPQDLQLALKDQGVIAETMDTGAACRTYNVLMAEGRNVATALFLLT